MSIQALSCTLSRLSVGSIARRCGPASSSCASTNQLLSTMHSNHQRQPRVCSLHTSVQNLRRLDSHKYPPSLEPSTISNRWEPRLAMRVLYPEYTIKPLPYPRSGGRGPNGHIFTHRKGGGLVRQYRMIDWIRGGPSSGKPLEEKVHQILPDKMRTAKIALVSSGERRRYIIATENMKPGDIIKSSTELTKVPVRAKEGDSYPLGSLPVGTLVNSIQVFVGHHGNYACAAGVTALLLRKVDGQCIVRLPSKQEVTVSCMCTATVGRVSNIHHNKVILGTAGATRRLGIRPKSGRWHRKHPSIFGRKNRGPKKMKVYTAPAQPKAPTVRLSVHN